jgi:hypothetical protein
MRTYNETSHHDTKKLTKTRKKSSYAQLSIFQELELAGISLGELLLEKANQGAQFFKTKRNGQRNILAHNIK